MIRLPSIRISLALVALLISMIYSCLYGTTSISVGAIWSAFIGGESLDRMTRVILWQIRVPRMICGVMVGGALATAGVGFQGLFRNPLAEPYVIGASSGAALGVAVVIVAGLRASMLTLGATTLAAMIGSLLVVSVVLAIGSLSRSASTTVLLLAGVVVGSLASALVSALMFVFDQKAVVILSWLMGSLAGSHWGSAIMVAIVGGAGSLAIGALARPLDVYTLGDSASQSIGLDLRLFRGGVIAAASLATAGAVAAAGVIGFVGLIAPHIARLLVGTTHARLIPMSFCVGGVLMLIADVIARAVIAPAEMPVGIVTALLGCPLFLVLLLRGQRRGSDVGVVA